MQITPLEIEGLFLIEPKVFGDDRGYFMETFRQDKLNAALGFSVDFVQDNESKSSKGVLRGLHYQLAPHAQGKLVRVIQGRVLDVAVDIRKGSATFGKHVAVELSADNKKQFFVPRGFAHGFAVLEDDTIFAYKVDNLYAPDCDRGIAFNDPDLDIAWILNENEMLLSEKDMQHPVLKDAEIFEASSSLYPGK